MKMRINGPLYDATYRKKMLAVAPWKRFAKHARERCTNPNHVKFKRYGARGILYDLTFNDLEIMWLRDRAFEMKSPTIDRIENDGNYTFTNCRFLERSDNIRKRQK